MLKTEPFFVAAESFTTARKIVSTPGVMNHILSALQSISVIHDHRPMNNETSI